MASAGIVYIDANDNIVKGSISATATAVPGIGNLASDKILTLTGDLSSGNYYGGFGNGAVNSYQLILDNANISMGYAIGGYSTATNNAENNVVKIKNSNVAWVLGGMSDGNAKKNTVELINSTAVKVTGGTGNGGYATDNSVYMTDSKVTETVQGGDSGNAVIDKVSGNTLYLAGANTIGGDVSNFEKIYITEAKFGTPALILNGSIQNNPTIDTRGITFTGVDALNAGQKTILIQNNMTNYPAEKILSGKYKVGSTLEGLGTASISDDDLIYTIDKGTKMEAQEQTHNTVMGATASMAALSAGNDFVGAATEGLSMAGNTGTDGMATYANMGGGSMNVETGSHVKTHTWNAILALGHKNEKKLSTTEYGAFFEYGTGNYSTFNGDERGDGSTRYTGGGILGKWQKNNGFYVEGSLRAGSIHDDATNVLRDVNGNPYSYDTDATYWGAHIGVGREIKLNKTDILD
uniref:autotransporter outer membrane beta-barrel domain-containing protein n=1 Tax=Anaerovibrio sp. TaxID=1872532 RepID=UPI00388DEC3E